jgi:poly-gamma-glutamate synthesis protein (capsule biosynthesis protein)
MAAFLAAWATAHAGYRAAPCASTELTASIPGAPQEKQEAPERLTLVLVGDTGFNATDARVDPTGIRKGKHVTPFAETLSGIAPLVDGSLAFVNLETVVTDRNDLKPEPLKGKGAFHFRSHPAALKALMDTGFNLFSLANNHAMDYGPTGAEETLYHMAVAAAERPVAYAGLGADFEEATKPGCLDLGGVRIGLGAIGIITGDLPQHRAGPDKPGQASFRDRGDFETVVKRLTELPADYRILSVHYGLEGRVEPDERQIADLRNYAAKEKGIDLIVGHHPHVVQAVELDGTSLIFYGLGNFMHPGTAEMTRFGLCRDYGLLAKVHLARADAGWKVEAIEAVPLTKTNVRPEPFASAENAQARIYALNHLAGELDDEKSGARGVRFTPQSDGSGLYCAAGAGEAEGEVGLMCRNWQAAAEPPKPLARKIAQACEDKPFYGQPARKKRKRGTLPPVTLPTPFGNFRF